MDLPEFIYATLCLLTILQLSVGVNFLSPNQTLADGDVLISPAQMFEVGFFSPGKSTARFLGIWYKDTPDIVIWVANRNNPIMDSTGVLTLSQNGTLFVTTAQRENIWSSGSSAPASSPVLRLLDTGNLVVSDISSNTWQSFDYPTDTRLPGMKMVQNPDNGVSRYLTSWKSDDDPSIGEFSYKIENQGLSQVVIMKAMDKIFRGIFWNGYFPEFPVLPDGVWINEVESTNGRLTSLFSPSNISADTRLTMNYTGLLQRYVMNERRDGWIALKMSAPRESCERYGWCGVNSICKESKSPECECLRGFKPRSGEEWKIFDWKSGCNRIPALDCLSEDGFLKIEGIKLPDSLDFRLNTSMSIDECRDECLKNCNCTAYADPYSGDETSCLMWFGDLIDMRELMSGDPRLTPTVYIRVPVTELDWEENKKESRKKLIFIAAASGFGVLILSLSFCGLLLRMRRKRRACKKTREELELPLFDLATIASATNNFSSENLIGEGGFGHVYKGNLSSEEVIAVKRMSRSSGQGPQEFKNEVTLISKLQHRNLVRILGCCTQGEEKMLIYEYMQNKSLDYFIFDEIRRAELSWPHRFDIIMGIARGLLYLHHDSRLKVIHRDLKTSNILLDENLNAKISDFGLARMFEGGQTTARTKRVVGT